MVYLCTKRGSEMTSCAAKGKENDTHLLYPVLAHASDIVSPARARDTTMAHHEEREEERDHLSCTPTARPSSYSDHGVHTGSQTEREARTHGFWVARGVADGGVRDAFLHYAETAFIFLRGRRG